VSQTKTEEPYAAVDAVPEPQTTAEFVATVKTLGWTSAQMQTWFSGYSGLGAWLKANPALTLHDAWVLCLAKAKETAK